MNLLLNKMPRYFTVTKDVTGVVFIQPDPGSLPQYDQYLDCLEEFVDTTVAFLQQPDTAGIIYSRVLPTDIPYDTLIELSDSTPSFGARLEALLSRIQYVAKAPKPLVALMDGVNQGVVLATALWASIRIATDSASFCFPECRYGLLPPLGAATFTFRRTGVANALPWLIQGTAIPSAVALNGRLVDQLASDMTAALAAAKRWIGSEQTDSRKAQGIGGAQDGASEIADWEKRANLHIPGISACLHIAEAREDEVTQLLAMEYQHYAAVLQDSRTRSMVRTLYRGVREAQQPLPEQTLDFELQKLGVVGAGMMGAGIALEAARAGVQVILKDVTYEQAVRGKEYAEKVTAKLVQQQRLDESARQSLLQRIQPTAEISDLAKSDLIIEAVFEDKELKAKVTAEAMTYLDEDGFFASNTTSLPITSLATSMSRPERFIGMHFFSPVDRMPLVEIICGKQTSGETRAKALAVVRKLGKVPITVHDSPAFFTSRIFFNYLLEAITMLLEGIPASVIETEARTSGFAVGPLAVLDEISLPLMLHVYDQLPQLHESQRRAYTYLTKLVGAGREGRKAGKGFYTYDIRSGTKSIWADDEVTTGREAAAGSHVGRRLLHIMALDSFRCLDEGVLERPIDGDIGSILGVGYAPQTGGVFGHIDQIGLQTFVEECRSFRPSGEQWDIPPTLVRLAEKRFSFYTGFRSNWRV